MENDNIVMISRGATFDGKVWLRSLRLRELDGYDEQYLASLDKNKNVLSPMKTTELLAKVATFVDTEYEQISYLKNEDDEKRTCIQLCGIDIKELIRRLTIGDRVALLLHLRRLMFGDIMRCEIRCPLCNDIISLDLHISNLLLQSVDSLPKAEYFFEIDNFALILRPLTGKDQEAMSSLDHDNYHSISECTERIVRSCIVSSEPSLPENLSQDFIGKISSRLEQLDPQADILLNMTCPSCKQFFQIPFFAEDFIFQEISALQKQLEQEIHCLALYYHWNERDILSLPLKRRKKYVEFITRSLSREEWL